MPKRHFGKHRQLHRRLSADITRSEAAEELLYALQRFETSQSDVSSDADPPQEGKQLLLVYRKIYTKIE